MSFIGWKSRARFSCLLVCAAVLTTGVASAQAAVSGNQSSSNSSGWSSSSWSSPVWTSSESTSEATSKQLADASAPASLAALPSAPSPSASAAASEKTGSAHSRWHVRDIAHRLTYEVGAGFNAPSGDKQYITWGGQLNLGAGLNINNRLAMLIEYQLLDDKIPGAIIAESGATGGHYHIWSFTMAPVFDLFPKATNNLYATGGGGFYRKRTDFTDVLPAEYCSFYGCTIVGQSTTVGSFSSNQGGFNVGLGFQHRLGGMYEDGKTKLFAEARFIDVLSPAVNGSANGLGVTAIGGNTMVVPITLGVRW